MLQWAVYHDMHREVRRSNVTKWTKVKEKHIDTITIAILCMCTYIQYVRRGLTHNIFIMNDVKLMTCHRRTIKNCKCKATDYDGKCSSVCIYWHILQNQLTTTLTFDMVWPTGATETKVANKQPLLFSSSIIIDFSIFRMIYCRHIGHIAIRYRVAARNFDSIGKKSVSETWTWYRTYKYEYWYFHTKFDRN